MRFLKLLLIVGVLAFGLSSAISLAAGSGTHGKVSAPKHGTKVYACPKCDAASMKAGKCPMCGDKMEMIQASVGYGCASCHSFSAKAGKCPKCKSPMTKMAMTYACEKCHTTSMSAGKCPKCKKAMTKHVMTLKA